MQRYRVEVVDTITNVYDVEAQSVANATERAMQLNEDGVTPVEQKVIDSFVTHVAMFEN